MMIKQKFKAIIFDFGLVISTQRPAARFQKYEQELGIAPGTINRIMFDSPAWQEALLGRLTMPAFWYAIGPSLGLTTKRNIDAFRRRYHRDETANQRVVSLIRRLHGQYRLAVLSNHPSGLDQWLIDWNLRHFFDVLVCSGDIGRIKPDPAIYHATLDSLEVRASEAVFIDDTTGHVSAAQSLGIHGIVFVDARQLERDLKALLIDHWPKNPP